MGITTGLYTVIFCFSFVNIMTCTVHSKELTQLQDDLEIDIDSEGCGISGYSTSRVTRMLRGQDAEITEFPWIVLLRFFKPLSDHPGEMEACRCTGFLITSKYILTAAHCVHGIVNGTFINVTVGSDSVDDSPNNVALYFQEHESYINDIRVNDIALVKLEIMVSFNEYVAPICIRPERTDFINQTLHISGFGETGTLMSTRLQKGHTTVIDFDHELILTSSLDGESQACEGDSGGPLMYRENRRFYAVGVFTRFGPGDCITSVHGVYTPISEYQHWIETTIHNLQQRN